MRLPTLGGKQFWSDEFVHRDWRIQRHVLSGHCRLLDPANIRQASGSFETCREQFQHLRETLGIAPLDASVVVLLHGLIRSRNSMKGLARYLTRDGFCTLNVGYASTREPIAEHARRMARLLKRLEGVQTVSFVAHSMGNLVLRHLLSDLQQQPLEGELELGRFVMLAPPNHGSALARHLNPHPLFQAVAGHGGRQIAEWLMLAPQLATPSCPFGILAGGGRDDRRGRNPLLIGDDDLVVSVAETRLAGARDFLVVPVLHSFIMDHPRTRECTARFLRHGYFLSEQQRQPIPLDEETESDG